MHCLSLPQHLVKTLCVAVTKGATRYALTGIQIEIFKDHVTLVASDTYRLVAMSIDADGTLDHKLTMTSDKPIESFIVYLKEFKEYLKTVKFGKRYSLLLKDLRNLPHIDGQFPVWRSCVPDFNEQGIKFHTKCDNGKVVLEGTIKADITLLTSLLKFETTSKRLAWSQTLDSQFDFITPYVSNPKTLEYHQIIVPLHIK